MVCEELELGNERPESHLPAFADDTASLAFNIDGVDVEHGLDVLDKREACFFSPRHFEAFYDGQMIGPAVLSLQEDSLVVFPVVKAKNWPMIHVEFLQLSEKDRQTIGRSLAASAGGRRPPAQRRKYLATHP
jgi:hypothetical protein